MDLLAPVEHAKRLACDGGVGADDDTVVIHLEEPLGARDRRLCRHGGLAGTLTGLRVSAGLLRGSQLGGSLLGSGFLGGGRIGGGLLSGSLRVSAGLLRSGLLGSDLVVGGLLLSSQLGGSLLGSGFLGGGRIGGWLLSGSLSREGLLHARSHLIVSVEIDLRD